MAFARHVELPVPSGGDDGRKRCTMRYTIVMESVVPNTRTEDCQKDGYTVGDQ